MLATRSRALVVCANFALLTRDARRGKGKRGGLRVIYYWWEAGLQFWLYTLYDKDERDDLSPQQRKTLRAMLKAELEARRKA